MTPKTLTIGQRMAAVNRFRETLNPMRNLTMTRARTLMESYPRGEYADLMWTFGAPFTGIECADADLMALIDRRTSALLEMDWDIRTVTAEDTAAFDEKLAEDQAQALREAYDRIDNFYDAIEAWALATFRGFAHAEKVRATDGSVTHLEIVDQWNVVRDGMYGQWKYNPEARQTGFSGLGDDMVMDPAAFIIREVRRPVNRIALVKTVRMNLSQRDWDAFIEIYGVPGGIVIMPPLVEPEKVPDYEAAAEKAAAGGSGVLPHGGDYKPNDGPRGVNPFRDHLEYLTQKLVLAGTGGLLTMLTQSGSGTLAGGAHSDTFRAIAKAEAQKISTMLQRQFDAEILQRNFAGKPVMAYFQLAANEETDTGDFVNQVKTLKDAGYVVSVEQVQEKTGLDVTMAAAAVPTGFRMNGQDGRNGPQDPALLANRMTPPETDRLVTNAIEQTLGVSKEWLKPVDDLLAQLDAKAKSGISDGELMSALDEFATRMPELFAEMDHAVLAKELEAAMGPAVVAGVADVVRNRSRRKGQKAAKKRGGAKR